MSGFTAVFVTASSIEEAENIAITAVKKKYAACANIISGVKSIYRWKDKICEESEVLIIMKTKSALFSRLEEEIRKLHSYELPEIIALPIAEGSADYLKWVAGETLPLPE